jgi:protein involved in polysaccharide export with SLBB domain
MQRRFLPLRFLLFAALPIPIGASIEILWPQPQIAMAVALNEWRSPPAVESQAQKLVAIPAAVGSPMPPPTTSIPVPPPSSTAPPQVEISPQLEIAPKSVIPAESNSIPAASVQYSSIDTSYRLGAGDRVLVALFNVPEYSGEQQVSLDGSVNLPLVGKVLLAGRTVEEAERLIAKRYEPELRHSIVRLNLIQARPMQIVVTGEVKSPGPYVLSLGTTAQLPTIAQAIQAAGGLTQSANLRQVRVQRQGSTQLIAVDLWELLQNGDGRQNLALRDGDTIAIAPTTQVNIAETTQLAASSLAAAPNSVLDVAVVGEIVRPGAYKLGASGGAAAGPGGLAGASAAAGNSGGGGRPTVTAAIQQAGGVKPSADLRQIQVRRVTRSGKEQLINLNFWKLLQGGDLSQDLVLQQGDTIIIPLAEAVTPADSSQLAAANLSPGAIRVNLVGEVKQPGAIELPTSTTLNQAILALGGLDNARASNEVELVRLNPNGTISQRVIKINLKQGVDSDTNPILWNNDIIIVGKSRSARVADQINKILGPVLQLLPPLRLFLK